MRRLLRKRPSGRRSDATPKRRSSAAPPKRHPSYFVVAGVDLRAEMQRLRGLAVFARGPLAESEPELKVRRASSRPNRLGFAVPGEWRLSVTAYPQIRPGDALETLLHELVHLHVGRQPGGHAWHGRVFKRTLARAMAQAYGIDYVRPASTLHGVYAQALEQKRLREGEQLELPLAG